MRELLAAQRADGGWSDLDSMESGAYATGKSLVALQTAGLSISDAAYERGVQFLLKTQQEDGSWYVKSRAMACQGKVEMSPFWQSRNVPFSLGLCGQHVNLRAPVKRRRALLASNPIKE
jgi:hypothetical protein